jgi:hypothetical protein
VDALASHCGGLTSLIIAPCSSNISVNNWSTTLSDASLISVVRLPHLQSLSLHYDVSNEAMKTLQSLSTVTYLGLGYNNAVEAEIFGLKNKMPNLVHLRYTTDPVTNHDGDLQTVGESLYPVVKERLIDLGYADTILANKITGMLLDLDLDELQGMCKNHQALFDRVQEALDVLDSATEGVAVSKVSEEDILLLRESILSATKAYLESENEDLEIAEKIIEIIMATNDLSALRHKTKIESNLTFLIKNTLETNLRQKTSAYSPK